MENELNKQTAVEWLAEQFDSIVELYPSQFEKINNAIEQAKQMEKEQIKEAYRSFNCFSPSEYNIDDEDCEKYYEQTYGGNK